jgi:hypothetical protein
MKAQVQRLVIMRGVMILPRTLTVADTAATNSMIEVDALRLQLGQLLNYFLHAADD